MNKPLTGCRILVVEDEMLLSLTLKDMLVDLRCSSVTATETTEKALSLIAGKTFDAAVLDMNLKGESSRSVAEALAARNVPFVSQLATDLCGMVSTAPFFESLSSIPSWQKFWRAFFLDDVRERQKEARHEARLSRFRCAP